MSPQVPVRYSNLSPELAQGLFARSGAHKAVVRLSTSKIVLSKLLQAAHQPLGDVNRARRDTYQHSADFRARANGCPIHEPRK